MLRSGWGSSSVLEPGRPTPLDASQPSRSVRRFSGWRVTPDSRSRLRSTRASRPAPAYCRRQPPTKNGPPLRCSPVVPTRFALRPVGPSGRQRLGRYADAPAGAAEALRCWQPICTCACLHVVNQLVRYPTSSPEDALGSSTTESIDHAERAGSLLRLGADARSHSDRESPIRSIELPLRGS